jgi:hypothetical protein
MNVEEQVRRTLLAYAEDVPAGPAASRAAQAREQARAMRVRRNAGVVAGIATLAAVAIGVGASGMLRADPPPDPAPQPNRVVDVAPSFAGRTLITSGETHDGEPLFLRVDAPVGSQWMVTCAGVGPEYVVHRAIDGEFEETAPCSHAGRLGDTMSFRWSSAEPVGSVEELAVWITKDGQAVQPDGAVLAAAVYTLPEPVTTLASTDIEPLEVSLGREWAYLDSIGSERGERRLTARFPALDEEVLLELVTDPVGGTAEVELRVDGVASASPRTFPLGGSSLGDTLSAGQPHTVTLRIIGEVPPDARLGIVRRTLASE